VTRRAVRRALVSVSDKTGLAELAGKLHHAGVELVSTGSTGAAIEAAGVPVTAVSDVTGFPEVLDGRVKTLHPAVHAGILADLRRPAHSAQLADLGIHPFDLVVVNLYPFAATVAAGAPDEDVIEQIDIGGPTLIRAAAKNHENVAVVVDPGRYAHVVAAVEQGGFTSAERQQLAAAAFAHTAGYDVAVASWFARDESPPRFAGVAASRATTLRYGENPHQQAALYVTGAGGLAAAEQLAGKEMSYNNYVDADAARRAVADFAQPCVAIVKHANPCGLALGDDLAEAHRKALACDPVSAYGGVVAANRPLDAAVAEQIAEVFTEVLVAPGFADEALATLARRSSLRILRTPVDRVDRFDWRAIDGGLLLQTPDRVHAAGDDPQTWTLAAGPPADERTLADLDFAWRAVRAVKSNAILLAADRATVGVGMGQVNRVDAARLAVTRAGDRAATAVAASDAFFPFADGLQVLAAAGVRAVVQPGGSKRDADVISAAAAAGMSMYITGVRHFWH
jgi:phosphoribosylaminoimidazolecarboxamide formyltransferase/IMP cyclohydrolase